MGTKIVYNEVNYKECRVFKVNTSFGIVANSQEQAEKIVRDFIEKNVVDEAGFLPVDKNGQQLIVGC